MGAQMFITNLWTEAGVYREGFGELSQYIHPELNANKTTSLLHKEMSSQGGETALPNYWSPDSFPGLRKLLSHSKGESLFYKQVLLALILALMICE